MPGIHCIPPWKRERSPRKHLPMLATYLLVRHASEWIGACRGTLQYHYVGGIGYCLLLKTPAVQGQWLASAWVITRTPKRPSEWRGIRKACQDGSAFATAAARHRYVFIRSSLYDDARRHLGQDLGTLLDWGQLHRCG